MPIRTKKLKPKDRASVILDKAESESDSSKKMLISPVIIYDSREGSDRRKRRQNPMLDTRSGRDRRLDGNRGRVDITA